MSTDIPTPNPRPTADPDVYDDNLRLRRSVDQLIGFRNMVVGERDALAARVRAVRALLDETNDDVVSTADLAEALGAVLPAETRPAVVVPDPPVAPAESVAAGSAVPAEGSAHPQPTTEPFDESRVARRMDRWMPAEGGSDV